MPVSSRTMPTYDRLDLSHASPMARMFLSAVLSLKGMLEILTFLPWYLPSSSMETVYGKWSGVSRGSFRGWCRVHHHFSGSSAYGPEVDHRHLSFVDWIFTLYCLFCPLASLLAVVG